MKLIEKDEQESGIKHETNKKIENVKEKDKDLNEILRNFPESNNRAKYFYLLKFLNFPHNLSNYNLTLFEFYRLRFLICSSNPLQNLILMSSFVSSFNIFR
jgi:hypothetical protein